MKNASLLFLLLISVFSVRASLNDHSILQELDAITEETPLHKLKDIVQYLLDFKEDVKEIKELSDRTRLRNQLSALAFYQDFVINTKLNDWSWLCHEFLTEDVNMTVYTISNGTFQFMGCENVTKFYNSTVSGLWNFMYHPYSNPWIEFFDNGTANTLVSGMNNAVMKSQQGNAAFWTFNYYSFGWIKTWHGWRIQRFTHLSSFTVPYQGAGWANIPVPFTTLYNLILQEYPILGGHFRDAIEAMGYVTDPTELLVDMISHFAP